MNESISTIDKTEGLVLIEIVSRNFGNKRTNLKFLS